MPILVTGGSGFIGLNLAEILLERGDTVVLFGASAPPPPAMQALDALAGRYVIEEGDVSDRATIQALFERHRPDRVIHGAAITAGAERDAREPHRVVSVNLLGTLNVLEASRAGGVKRLVYTSTGALYGRAGAGLDHHLDEDGDRPVPETIYGITKYAAERSVLRLGDLWGLDVVVGRLAQVYGRWEYSTGVRDTLSAPWHLTRAAIAGEEAVLPPLPPQDFIYAPDVARGIVALLDAATLPHRLYHLGVEQPFSPLEWCGRLRQRFPGFRYRESNRPEEWTLKMLVPFTRTPFSTRRLREDLGWQPAFPPERAFGDYVDWIVADPSRAFGNSLPR